MLGCNWCNIVCKNNCYAVMCDVEISCTYLLFTTVQKLEMGCLNIVPLLGYLSYL